MAAITRKFRNHPELVRNWEILRAIEAFTDGKTWNVSKYLARCPAEADGSVEGKQNFLLRLQRLYNVNYCSPHLKQHHAHMSQPMTIAGAEGPKMKAVTEDVTGYDDTAERMARKRLMLYLRDGRVGTLVDGPQTISPSRAGARTANERSYQVLYSARQIRYWERFESGPRKGKLRKVVLEEAPVYDDAKGEMIERFRYFEQPDNSTAKFQWAVLSGIEARPQLTPVNLDPLMPWWNQTSSAILNTDSGEYPVLDSGMGGLNYIPFLLMGNGPDESFVNDVWQLNLIYMNLLSVLSNIIYNQGFQKSIFAGVDKEELAKMSEWLATIVSNPDIKVFTVDPGNPEACFQELSRLEQQMERRAKFEFNQLADDTRHVQSASSKSKDLITRQAIYDQTVDLWTEVEKKIYQAHADFEGADRKAVDVHIDRDYGLEDYKEREVELLTVFNQARELGVVDLQKEVLKMRVAKLRFLPRDGKSEEDVRNEMLSAIETATPVAQQATNAVRALGYNAFGGKGTGAPGDKSGKGPGAPGKGGTQGPPQAQNPPVLFGDTTGVSALKPTFDNSKD